MVDLRIPARLQEPMSRLGSRTARRAIAAIALTIATMLIVWMLGPRTSGTEVLVAARTVAPGTEISAGDLTTREFPAPLVPDEALRTPDEAIGRSAAGHLTAGTPLTRTSVVAPRDTPVEAGQLLMPVTVTDEAAAQTLQPGHRVRIYSTAGGSGGNPDPAEETEADGLPGALGAAGGAALVDEAVVASVTRTSGNGLGAGATIATLVVSEDQAAALASAALTGLSFALLN